MAEQFEHSNFSAINEFGDDPDFIMNLEAWLNMDLMKDQKEWLDDPQTKDP